MASTVEVPVEALRALVDALRLDEWDLEDARRDPAEDDWYNPEDAYRFAEQRRRLAVWAFAEPLAACLPEARSDA